MIKLYLQGPFNNLFSSRQAKWLLLLASILLLQSMGVIYTKQMQRLLHAKLQATYAARDRSQVEWSKLLLELGSCQADARVEAIARDQLGMVVPEKIDVIKP